MSCPVIDLVKETATPEDNPELSDDALDPQSDYKRPFLLVTSSQIPIMCDKLQTSKDGSVDLSHGRQSDCRSVQPLSTNGSNSSSYKKQKKAYGKGESCVY